MQTRLTLILAIFVATTCSVGCNTGSDGGSSRPDATETDGTSLEQMPKWCDGIAQTVPEGPAPGCPSPDPTAGEVCSGDDRYICGVGCVPYFDRTCMTDGDCFEFEACRLRDPGDSSGTCFVTELTALCCPGGPGCESSASDSEGGLRAGFAAVDMTPRGWEVPRPEYMPGSTFQGNITDPSTFCDCGNDGICPETEEFADCPKLSNVAYPGPDADGSEGDGVMQGMWIAGFGNGRSAMPCTEEEAADSCDGPHCCYDLRAHDPVWARAIVLELGSTRVAWVTLDVVGFFYEDIREVGEAIKDELNLDHVMISSTHTHEAPDGMGQWGPQRKGSGLPVSTGLTDEWRARIEASIEDAVTRATTELRAVDLYAADVDTGVEGMAVRDSLEPWIVDDRALFLAFTTEGGSPTNNDEVLATVVNWHNHPEALWSRNTRITSDFPHFARHYMQEGLPSAVGPDEEEVSPAIDGMGGMSMYVTGVVGGMTTPGGATVIDRAGVSISENGWEKADAMGQRLAEFGLTALREQAERISEDQLTLRTRQLLIPVNNAQLSNAVTSLRVFRRQVYNARFSDFNGGSAQALLRTAVTSVRIGELTIQTVPGEIFPELVVGFNAGQAIANPVLGNPDVAVCGDSQLPDTSGELPCIVTPDDEDPPPLDDARTDGFLREIMPSRYELIVGLGEDELGYLVPSYDYRVTDILPGLSEVPGDHYEETNSVSDCVDQVLETIGTLYD